jgi:hypothetical protein
MNCRLKENRRRVQKQGHDFREDALWKPGDEELLEK